MEQSGRRAFFKRIAFLLYLVSKGVRQAVAFFQGSIHRIFFLLVLAGIFLGYYGPAIWERISFSTFEGPNVLVKIFDERSQHFCVVQPFTLTMQAGTIVSSEVLLTPSREGQSYALSLGKLPEGMRGEFDEARGSAPGKVRLTLMADSTVSKGSYTIIILYKEGRLPNNCQLNVIVQ